MQKSFVLITLAAALLAGCGGSGASKLRATDVAVVGSMHVTSSSLDALLARAKRNYEQQGQKFPKQGTTNYLAVRGQAVSILVQEAELEEKAAAMGIEVTDAQIDKRLAFLKKKYYSGSQKKYLADIKKQGYTNAQVRTDVIRPQLISEAIQKQLSKGIKVTDADVHAYYVQHASLYQQPATRSVRYILVGKSKATAESVYRQLAAGTTKTWCTLSKKYAKDTSAQTCGKTTFSKGQTVAVFDKKAFSAPAGKVVKPFYDPTQYKAWFVIEPLGPVKASSTTPEKQVAATIRQTLVADKQKQVIANFSSTLKKTFCSDSKIRYQVGYAPSGTQDPCAATTTNATTTG
jgi:peptidyl-prolyl cis-trans isomerase C